MAPDEIRFDSLKEDRGWYYVEYSPPIANYRFSMLQLSIVDEHDTGTVVAALESEVRSWLRRYPVPIMATAFSADGNVFLLRGVRPIDSLLAWLKEESPEPVLCWELVGNEVLPDIALDKVRLKEIFADVPYRTGREILAKAAKHATSRRVGWWVFFVWAVAVPLGVAVLEWWSDLLGLLVLSYAFLKAAIQGLRLTGKLPKSTRQLEKEAMERKMRHHHYHCERNPEAFERLKFENFRREEFERTKAQARALKKSSNASSSG